MKIKINLFRKIFLFSVSLIIFTVSLSYILSTFAADSFYIARKKNEIIKIKNTALKFADDEYVLEEYIENIQDKEGINIQIENKESRNSHHRRRRNRYGDIGEGFNVVSLPNTNITLLIYKEDISSNKTLFATTSLSVMGSHRHEVYLLNLITLAAAMGISIFISRKFAKNITDNIGVLNRTAQKISCLDFSEKPEINTTDELKDLSRSIGIMADNISSSIEGLNTFVSNASHELKTPIAVINTHAQYLLSGKITDETERKKYCRVILNESSRMDTLVKDLLLMSILSSADTNFQKENFDLKELLKESIEQFEFLELQKDIEWEISLDNIKATGSRKLLKIAFNNIIQNSLKYSPENSKIQIYQKENKICFENPMYLSEGTDTEKLFQPFFRGKNATEIKIEGSGLGLSLIKRIFDIHMIKHGAEIQNNKFIFWFDIFR